MMQSIWWLPGAALITMGVLIALFPELLSLIVASALVMSGMSALLFGNAIRRARVYRTGSTIRTVERDYWL
jgi:hypothetical protein